MDNAGNIGVGTINPTSPLEIKGNITITKNSGGGLIFQDGTTQTTAAPPVGSGAGLVTTTTLGATTLGVDPTVFQKRVSGNCPSGAISQIAQDGTVTCVSVGGSSGAQTGYFTANLTAAVNAAPGTTDYYRFLLDQPITVTSIAVTSTGAVANQKCAQPVFSLSNGVVGRDIVLPYYLTELNSDSESLTFAQYDTLHLGIQQGLYCPPSLAPQSAPSYKVVVRYRPATANDTNQCAPGTTSCNGYCADLMTSVSNCGACGTSCQSGPNTAAACVSGTCSYVCTNGAVSCNGSCVQTSTDSNNCGSCGSACGNGSTGGVCVSGRCSTCPTNSVACNGTCCASGQVCGPVASNKYAIAQLGCSASCPTGMTACNGVCVDTTSDYNNCGSCNTSCSAGFYVGLICSSGQCVCPGGGSPSCSISLGIGMSAKACVSSTNPYACGTCGNSCASASDMPTYCGGVMCGFNQVCGTVGGKQVCQTQTCSAGTCSNCQSGVICGGACCPVGQFCVNGSCATSNQACQFGQTYCGSSSNFDPSFCVDTSTQQYNCGFCGHQCAANQVCSNGQCQTAPVGQVFCSGAWITQDNNNCGACGRKCGTGATCASGNCQCVYQTTGNMVCAGNCVNTLADPNNCNGCGNVCPAGQSCYSSGYSAAYCKACASGTTLCGNTCATLLTDSSNCGGCGWACLPGQLCSQGQCVNSCSAGQMFCPNNGGCKSVQTDTQNCGVCGVACASGMTCTNGVCQTNCASGTTACVMSGTYTCTNLQTDNQNCGACGWVCAGGQACVSGTCPHACSTGQSFCSGNCVTLQTDPNNCGGCGNACASNQICSSGQCLTQSCSTGSNNMVCNNVCINRLTNHSNCGACGVQCASSQTCLSGACTACASPSKICGSICADLQNDANNCGSCNQTCSAGSVCTGGNCCNVGNLYCSNKCVDGTSDRNNCGGCGHVCSSTSLGTITINQLCANSQCVCPSGTAQCGKNCTYLAIDAVNCGACGKKCNISGGEVCNGGQCVQAVSSSGS